MPHKARTAIAQIRKRDKCLACPHCKSLEGLAYCETEIITRKLDSFDPVEKKLLIDSHFDCDGDGDDPRFPCTDCGKECRIPKGITYDFQ